MTQRDVARSTFRPFRGIAAIDERPFPCAVLILVKPMDPLESRRQDVLAIDEDSVHQALVLRRQHLTFPFAGAVEDERSCLIYTHKRRIQDYAVDDAQPVRCGEPVDLANSPGTARISVVLQYGDVSNAVLRLIFEAVGQDERRNWISIRWNGDYIDHAR